MNLEKFHIFESAHIDTSKSINPEIAKRTLWDQMREQIAHKIVCKHSVVSDSKFCAYIRLDCFVFTESDLREIISEVENRIRTEKLIWEE